MRVRRSGGKPARIQASDLLHLGEARLAALLAEQIGRLPYPEQARWARQQLSGQRKHGPPQGARPAALLKEIEEFCAQSRAGAFVSWVDEDGWEGGPEEEDSGEFGEWVETFTELLEGGLALSRAARHAEATRALQMLFELLREAGGTTDILGNHGAPEDSIRLDFGKVIEAYTRSLAVLRRSAEEVVTEILPLATRHHYRGGLLGLARGLDREGRKRLEARLSSHAEAALRSDRPSFPPAAEGLIALATVAKDEAAVLAIKQRFAPTNAVYLQEVLAHQEKKRNWPEVARLAELGIERFGNRDEFARLLAKARDAVGDRAGAVEAQIAHFLESPTPARFVALKRRAERLATWPAVFERLLTASQPGRWDWGLRTRLLLAEGHEREAVDGVMRQDRAGFDELRLTAKYAVARLSEGATLTRFVKLEQLRKRLPRDEDDAYRWLRLILRVPGTFDRAEYGRVAATAYRRLVDIHLDSGKSSRAAPAAHYCAIVFETSRLLNESRLWVDLLAHLIRRHGRKRLIWARLKAEGCPVA